MSLQKRWFILLSLFFIITLSILGGFFYQLSKSSLEEVNIEKHKHLSLYIAQNLGEYLVLSNFATAERTIVSDLRFDPDVLFFFYENLKGEVLYSLEDKQQIAHFVDTDFQNPLATSSLNLARISSQNALFQIRETKLKSDVFKNNELRAKAGDIIYEIQQHCYYSNDRIGSFRLGLSRSDFAGVLKTQLYKIVTITFALLLTGLIIIHIYTLRLLKPVHTLTNQLQSIINPRSDLKLEQQIQQFDLSKIDDRTTELRAMKEAFLAFKSNLLNALSRIHQLNRVESMTLTVQMLAHDLRRPFSQLKMLLQNDSATPETLKNGFHQVEKSIEQIDSMMNDLMDFSKDNIQLQPHNLAELLKISVAQVRDSLSGSKIQIELKVEENTGIYADSGKAIRIFSNILSNAVEAILEIGKTEHGCIQINSHKIGALVQIEIHNTGPEIPADQLNHLFDLFYTKGKTKGTGLGLAIVEKLIQLHQGKISVENKNGVLFTIQFQSADMISQKYEEIIQAPRKTLVATLSKPKTLLHIEDESIYREGLTPLLQSTKDWGVLEAQNFSEAQSLFLNHKVDLAIVDVDLGIGPSGFDFARWAFEQNPHVQIFFHTNRAASEAPAIWRGRIIAKPMTQETFNSIIHSISSS